MSGIRNIRNKILRKIKGSGEKSYNYVGFRDVISIKSIVFFGTLTYLIRDVMG